MVLFGSDTIRKIIILSLTFILSILVIISNKENDLLILVNYNNPIRKGFSPNIQSYNGILLAKEVVNPLKEMEQELRNRNIKYKITEAYVSVKMQEIRFKNLVNNYLKKNLTKKEALKKAASIQILPRYSEHHTGLSIDFEGDKELYNWLESNAYKYGFILRYPKDKKSITKYEYNKIHYRYVGKSPAKEIRKNNLCLEEYLSKEEI